MPEQDRFQFLINRDGLEAAIKWEKQAAERYLIAAERALQPMQAQEKAMPARGREWSELYLQAALDCLGVIK